MLVSAYILTRAMLGVSGAGKTTVATQLRIWQDGGFDEGERASRRGAIYEHVVRAARLAVEAMQINGVECAEQYNRVCGVDTWFER